MKAPTERLGFARSQAHPIEELWFCKALEGSLEFLHACPDTPRRLPLRNVLDRLNTEDAVRQHHFTSTALILHPIGPIHRGAEIVKRLVLGQHDARAFVETELDRDPVWFIMTGVPLFEFVENGKPRFEGVFRALEHCHNGVSDGLHDPAQAYLLPPCACGRAS